jgi:hypothetical protein
VDAEQLVRQKWRLLKATLDERGRRLWAGAEADAIGFGGVVAAARATGLAISTVRKGRDEARAGARREDVVNVRRSAGKRPYEVVHPEVWPALEKLVDPVTRGDPEAGANPRDARDHGWDPVWNGSLPKDAIEFAQNLACNVQGRTWTPQPGANESKPINCVSWFEAFAFCIWDGGRLPSEVEWYYAASGGTAQLMFPWGNAPLDPRVASYNFCARGDRTCISSLALPPVGSMPGGAGRWRQQDLVGSVDEWVRDAYTDKFPAADPCDNCASLQTSDVSDFRVVAGGSWVSTASGLSLSERVNDVATSRSVSGGFRCASSP